MEHNPPQISSTAKPNWWKQNWKWFVPVGCFSIAVLFVIFIGSVALIVFSAVKSTDIYKEALARAKTHPEVIEVLGSPITIFSTARCRQIRPDHSDAMRDKETLR
jgi:hypothetical protein